MSDNDPSSADPSAEGVDAPVTQALDQFFSRTDLDRGGNSF